MIKYNKRDTSEGRLLSAIIKAGYFPALAYEGKAGWFVSIENQCGERIGSGDKHTRRSAIIAAIKKANKKIAAVKDNGKG